MKKKIWNKMVRDNVIQKLESEGIICEYENISDEIAVSELMQKINEEFLEFEEAETSEDKLKEAADVIEVCRSISKKVKKDLHLYPMAQTLMVRMLNIERLITGSVKILGFTPSQLENEIKKKNAQKGSFEQNFYLISTSENKKDSV